MSVSETIEEVVEETGADAFTLRSCEGPHVEPVNRDELFVVLENGSPIHHEAVETKGEVKIGENQSLYVYTPVDLDNTGSSSADGL